MGVLGLVAVGLGVVVVGSPWAPSPLEAHGQLPHLRALVPGRARGGEGVLGLVSTGRPKGLPMGSADPCAFSGRRRRWVSSMELSEERGLGPLPCPGSNAQLRWLRGGYGARREWWHLLGPILVWVICAGCVCVCLA